MCVSHIVVVVVVDGVCIDSIDCVRLMLFMVLLSYVYAVVICSSCVSYDVDGVGVAVASVGFVVVLQVLL